MKPNETELNGSEKLTRKQRVAIPHLIACRSIEQGCRKAKLSKVTLYRWMKDQTFNDALGAARNKVIEEALERLKVSITKGVNGLVSLTGAREKSIRLRACIAVVDFFLKIKQTEEIEGRLEKIERIIFERKSYR